IDQPMYVKILLFFPLLLGHHECEIFSAREDETAESEYKWKICEKNPGHEKFIPAQHFRENCLQRLHTADQRERLYARIDRTVRLRVSWTSLDRPGVDTLSSIRGTKLLRFGTGFLQYVEASCPLNEGNGQIPTRQWKFKVQTALHVVYNTEEAKQTR
ncbi:hypothetical protein ElyMa_003135100, partial [Elysia marginata]